MEEKEYAGFWVRYKATVIDVILLLLLTYPMFYFMYGGDFLFKASEFNTLNNLLNYVLPFIIIIAFWKLKGATPGKMLLKVKIVDEETLSSPTMKQWIIRYIGYFISLIPLGLGYFWVIWDKKKQAWHDKLSHTVLIRPKQEHKKRGFLSYVAMSIGMIILIVFIILIIIGSLAELGKIPSGNMYMSHELPEEVQSELIQIGALESDEELKYYQPEGMISFTDSGTLMTNRAIRYFETNETNDVVYWEYSYAEIEKLTLKRNSVIFEDEIVDMELYDKVGDMLFSVGIMFPKANMPKFKSDLIQTWQQVKNE